MNSLVTKDFFCRPTLEVAPELLGKFLVRRHQGKIVSAMVTEVEAYVGMEDKACHAARGKTKRNKVMFEEGGVWYVYLVYGMYWMLNIVTEKKDFPAALLLRGIQCENQHFNGPGKLTRKLYVDKQLNGKKASLNTGLWFEDRDIRIHPKHMKQGKRVGINYAGKWQHKLWRFYIEGGKYV